MEDDQLDGLNMKGWGAKTFDGVIILTQHNGSQKSWQCENLEEEGVALSPMEEAMCACQSCSDLENPSPCHYHCKFTALAR